MFGTMINSNIDNITIEVQDQSGNWRVHTVTQNIPAMILSEMKNVQVRYNGARVRAINKFGSVVDIM